MKKPLRTVRPPRPVAGEPLLTEVLVLPDGTILAHNLTPAFARLLRALNPRQESFRQRSRAASEAFAS